MNYFSWKTVCSDDSQGKLERHTFCVPSRVENSALVMLSDFRSSYQVLAKTEQPVVSTDGNIMQQMRVALIIADNGRELRQKR